MAWTVFLLGLLACGPGQGPGLCTLGAPPRRASGHLTSITTAFSLLSLLGVEAQTVIQEPALSVSPGGTVTLACALSSGSVTTYNEPSWYQQTPGQVPRNVIYNTNTRASGVPDRFSASISGNKATLTITGAQPEDEADYHCLLDQGSGSYSYTVVGAHGEVLLKPAHVPGGSAFRGRRGWRGWKWSAPLWGRRLRIHLLPVVHNLVLLAVSPRVCPGLQEDPSAHNDGKGGSGAHFINNIETQRPPTASTTLLVQRVLRDILSFINLMMESKIILVHFFTCAQ